MNNGLDVVILGLSITSSWGNGHATTYRGLVREMAALGHRILFLERDVPWYAANRDMPEADFAEIRLYGDMDDLYTQFGDQIRKADFVMIGSYVPEGVRVSEMVFDTATGVTAFYDIDTPVTLAKIRRGDFEYIRPDLISQYDLYLSFTGGGALNTLKNEFGARKVRPLYCSVDAERYRPLPEKPEFDLGYMGTYSPDRQARLDLILTEAARMWGKGRFVVAGPQFPKSICWPDNVERQDHIAPLAHCRFYNAQRFTLNITREDMIQNGYCPSVRLFEAAACGVPIISDYWQGLEDFFNPGEEILISVSPEDTLHYIREMDEHACRTLAERARFRVLAEHTAQHRAFELENYIMEAMK